VTDVALGPDRVLYVATTDTIWTVEPPFDAGPETSAWKTWVATGAIAVLVASLGARFLAGRRLRGDRPSVGA
jgi:hypothetical protein